MARITTDIMAYGPQGQETFAVDLVLPQADVRHPRVQITANPSTDDEKFVVLVPSDSVKGQLQVLVISGRSQQTQNQGHLICGSDGGGVRVEQYSHEGLQGEPKLEGREWNGIWIDEKLGPPPALGALGLQGPPLYMGV